MSITIQDILIEVETNPSSTLYLTLDSVGTLDSPYQIVDYTASGGIIYIDLVTNDTGWSSTIIADDDSMILSRTVSGSGSQVIQVEIDENTTASSRTCVINYYCNNDENAYVVLQVSQLGV